MKAGSIQLQLAATNPWWRSAGWVEGDLQLQEAATAPFRYRSGALRDLQVGGLYLLRGPRRAGKSTEIKHAIADLIEAGVEPRRIVHAPVDGWRASDLRTLITSAADTFLSGVIEPRYWFLDEISSVSGDWPNALKYLRDNDPTFARDTVVLTGSSAARLHEVRKALAGRRGEVTRTDRTLLPMRFGDFVAAAGVSLPAVTALPAAGLRDPIARAQVDQLLPFLPELVRLWESYLRVGGFPQAVRAWRQTGDVAAPLVDALWDVVYGDAIERARFSAPQAALLLDRLARGIGSPVNVADLARDLDSAHGTVRQRLADLAESFLTWPCHLEHQLAPKLSAQSKWYFVDPLLARLAGLRGYGTEPDHTQLAEQQVGLALLRSADTAGLGDPADHDAVLYHRSSTRTEIDFVGRGLGGVAIESKYADSAVGRDAQTLAASRWSGVITSRSVTRFGDEVDVLPAPMVVLLLGG
ncbi:ATP-binding protein [Natronosporangium hydrolyticum]|uniref:ATP-binding protein n=1 Tax=Natronosporangium hydrolyticum TaxID=2811111 RepID=A0A895YBF3_9ACTN|nr:AAA family ATPase [Natronosporangium hydrolyticum]QSB15087.1 ATP-binding protein [Natronosporangium hydrolyticum]